MAERSPVIHDVVAAGHLIQLNAISYHKNNNADVFFKYQMTHLVWRYEDFLLDTFVVSMRFLSCEVSRTLAACVESPFLHLELVVLPSCLCSEAIEVALPRTAEVTLPIMRVISSMLGTCTI